MTNKLKQKLCIECKDKFYVRPQHMKISKRCPECQRKQEHWYRMDLQRRRRAEKKEK